MWVGTGTRLEARKLPTDSDQLAVIASKFEGVRAKIANWQRVNDDDSKPPANSYHEIGILSLRVFDMSKGPIRPFNTSL